MKLFCAALTAAPVTGDNSIVPIHHCHGRCGCHCRRTAAYLPQKISAAYPPLVMYRRSFLFLGGPFPSLTYITIFVREMQHLPGKFYAKVKKFRAIWQI